MRTQSYCVLTTLSCKHFAHTGKSVSDTDELDIIDRVAAKENVTRGLKQSIANKGIRTLGGDIDDLMLPTLLLKDVMAYMNQLTDQDVSKEADEKMKQLYIRVFLHIVRELTDEEKQRVSSLMQFGVW